MANINLSAAVRSNLTSLQNTASLMTKTSDRLSSGNKVNSALDNPTNFFTASSLNSRAGDLNNLMDSMANGIKTIEAANNGLTSITKNLESMQSTLRQARQDKSFQTASYEMPKGTATNQELTLRGGSFASDTKVSLTKSTTTPAAEAKNAVVTTSTALTSVTVATTPLTFDVGGVGVSLAVGTHTADDVVNAINNTVGITATASLNGDGALVLTSTGTAGATDTLTVDNFSAGDATQLGFAGATATGTGVAAGTPSTAVTFKSVDEMVNSINNNGDINKNIRASNDNGKLRIENLSTQDLTVGGVASDGKINGTTALDASAKITGNSVRKDLAGQFNELRDQLDKLSDDASFNGINLLRGDKLKITFNETGSSSLDIQAKGEKSVNAANLKLSTTLVDKDLDSDVSIDKFLDEVKGALNSVRSQSSAFGSNLSIVQNRQDFTKSMINTLETGAGNLTLADMNQEAANMMALQTRQSLASSTLSMANQADQGVLQLLR